MNYTMTGLGVLALTVVFTLLSIVRYRYDRNLEREVRRNQEYEDWH